MTDEELEKMPLSTLVEREVNERGELHLSQEMTKLLIDMIKLEERQSDLSNKTVNRLIRLINAYKETINEANKQSQPS